MNETASQEIFNKLYMRVTLRIKDEVIQAFTKSLLDDPSALDENIYWKLVDIYNRDSLTAADATLLEHLVRYAEAQHYCRALRVAAASGAVATQATVPSFQPNDTASLYRMTQNLGGKVLAGARRNDIFGGCTTPISLGNKRKSKDKYSDINRKDTEGSPDDDEDDDDEPSEASGSDGLGPFVFECKKGHVNFRSYGRLRTKCRITTCEKGSVGCK